MGKMKYYYELEPGDVLEVWIPVPEYDRKMFYRVTETGFEGPFRDQECLTPLDIPNEPAKLDG